MDDPMMQSKPRAWKTALPWALFIIALAVIGYLLVGRGPAVGAANGTDTAKNIIQAVGKLVVLPPDETPTVATITDLAPLAGQPFFADASVGDKVLIYAKAGKAILYDPSADKIVEIAPVDTGAGASSTQPSGK